MAAIVGVRVRSRPAQRAVSAVSGRAVRLRGVPADVKPGERAVSAVSGRASCIVKRMVLDAIALRKRYRRGDVEVTAVAGVSLALEAGTFAAVVGPSGCGKSTLLHLCGGMDRPTAGEVRLGGRPLAALDDDALTRLRREQVGFVFQFFNLLPTLTVAENVALPLLLAGCAPAAALARAGEWAERVGVSHRLDHAPAQLSGGEAQRVAIARAVAHEPILLVADEPTGNLDSGNGACILDLLREVNRRCGTALLLATHDAAVAAAADRTVEMRDGRIVRSASRSAAGGADPRPEPAAAGSEP